MIKPRPLLLSGCENNNDFCLVRTISWSPDVPWVYTNRPPVFVNATSMYDCHFCFCERRGSMTNDNRKYYKCMRITTNQPDTKFKSNPNRNLNPTTEQCAILNIQLNILSHVIRIQINSCETMLLNRLYQLRCHCHAAKQCQ